MDMDSTWSHLLQSFPSDFSGETKSYSYYFRILFLAIPNFELKGPQSPHQPLSYVLSAAGQCPNQHRYKYVIAGWRTFGALLVGVALGYVLWVLLFRRHPGLLTFHALSDSTWNRILLCWHVVPLLGLGLYLYDLISDVEVFKQFGALACGMAKACFQL